MSDTHDLTPMIAAATGTDGRRQAAAAFVDAIKVHGVQTLHKQGIFAALDEGLKVTGGDGAAHREGTCMCIAALCSELGVPVVPFMLPLLPQLIELMGDKLRPVQFAALAAGEAIVDVLSEAPNAVPLALHTYLLGHNARWQPELFRMMVCMHLQSYDTVHPAECGRSSSESSFEHHHI